MSDTQTTPAAASTDPAATSTAGGADQRPDGPGEDEPLSSRPLQEGQPRGVRVTLDSNVPDIDPPLEDWLDVQLARIAALAGVEDGELGVLIVEDAEMADLHQRYKSVPGTTDVLTFDLRTQATGAVEGDIVICLDEAARQAAKRSHPVRLEALLYAVHGLLHLLGEDDETQEDAARMHRREDELLTAAGFDAVFATSMSGGDP